MLRRTLLQSVVIAAASISTLSRALAQDAAADYPNKVVTIIVPFPPGGTSDTTARLMAEQLTKAFGQQFLVDNKPGAGGNIGSAAAARAEADGYTLLLSGVGTNAINYTLYSRLSYEPSDLAHIGLFSTGPNVLVASPEFEAKTFKEFIDFAKAHPGELNYASSGIGSSGHLAMEMLKQQAGIELTHVAYKGGAPAMTDVMGGQVPVLFINQDAALPHVKAGKLRALAVAGPERSPIYPDTPTVAESGFPGFSAVSWAGLSAPAGTPPKPIIDKLNAALVKSMQVPELKERLEKIGFTLKPTTPEEYAAFIKAETEKWGQVIKTGNIKAE